MCHANSAILTLGEKMSSDIVLLSIRMTALFTASSDSCSLQDLSWKVKP